MVMWPITIKHVPTKSEYIGYTDWYLSFPVRFMAKMNQYNIARRFWAIHRWMSWCEHMMSGSCVDTANKHLKNCCKSKPMIEGNLDWGNISAMSSVNSLKGLLLWSAWGEEAMWLVAQNVINT